MKRIVLPIITVAALQLGGCSVDRLPGVYRIDVQQGNYLSPEQIEQLEIGMSRDQVRFVMGSPMLTDTFHADRWDYPYLYQPGSGKPRREHIVLHFRDNALARIEGSVEHATDDAGKRSAAAADEAETGLLTRFWNWLRN